MFNFKGYRLVRSHICGLHYIKEIIAANYSVISKPMAVVLFSGQKLYIDCTESEYMDLVEMVKGE